MSILKIAKLGHPVLRRKARELSRAEIRSKEIQELIEDMIETMREYGGVGLAAPQVHESVKLAILEIDEENKRYPTKTKSALTVFINPKMTVVDKKKHGFWEGCLSVPGLRGYVERPRAVRVDYLDRKGIKQTLIAEDFLATVVQHELDHLVGTVYLDRIRHHEKLAFVEEYRKYWFSKDLHEV